MKKPALAGTSARLPTPLSIALLQDLLHAAGVPTVPAALQAILATALRRLGASAAVIAFQVREQSALAARSVCSGHDDGADDPALANLLRSIPLNDVSQRMASERAVPVVRALSLPLHDGDPARLWLACEVPPDEPSLEAMALASALALQTVIAQRIATLSARRVSVLRDLVAESDARVDAVLATIPEPTVVVDESSQRIVHANAALARRFRFRDASDGAVPGTSVGRTLGEIGFYPLVGSGDHPGAAVSRVPTRYRGQPGWVLRVDDLRPAQRLRAFAAQAHRDAALGRLVATAFPQALAAEATLATALASMQFELLGARMPGSQGGSIDPCSALVTDALEACGRLRRALAGPSLIQHPDEDATHRLDVVPIVEAVLGGLESSVSIVADVIRDLARVPPVTASQATFALVVLHLLTNARHAVSDGAERRHTIRVSTRATTDTVIFEVTDDGCGIPADRLSWIFEPFETTWANAGGAGLGLSISRDVVEPWGGKIEVESAVGQGSTFRVVFPRVGDNGQ